MKPSALLFPERCMLCADYLPEGQRGLCATCREWAEQEMETVYCAPPEHTDAMICAARYRGYMRGVVTDLKFHGKRANVPPMAELMAQAWEKRGMAMPDVITCVPVSPTRARSRGFNQSEALAREIARRWDVPFAHTLKRRMLARRQSELHAGERWENARRTYVARDDAGVSGKTVLLVDDIVTTGATVSVCAGLLRESGAARVWGLAFAKA